jgi:hypothetical protein
VTGRRGAWAGLATTVAVFAVAGCGGGERQDSNEPSGTFSMNVVKAAFPPSQSLAKQEAMTISVKNTDSRPIPDLAVTVDSFSTRSQQAGLADPERPVWIVDEGPTGGTTAYTNTWALGRLAPGATRTFTWKVTAIQAGTHTVKYRVAAGLNGKAKAKINGRDDFEGAFKVAISGKPANSKVDPDTGKVIREGQSSGG